MSKTLDQVLDDLVGREGKYSNNPSDPGGPTMWGITQAVARAFGYQGEMIDLSKPLAKTIYKERYRLQPGLDTVAAASPEIAEELLDTAVNMGTSWPGRFLQRALNALNRGALDYPDLTVDGAIGKMTVFALATFLTRRGPAGEKVLLTMLNAQQSVRYLELAEGNKSLEGFEYGWQLGRVVKPL